jgi:hypothetical protein
LNLPFIPFKESRYVNLNALSILGLTPHPLLLPFEGRGEGAGTVKKVKFLFSGL